MAGVQKNKPKSVKSVRRVNWFKKKRSHDVFSRETSESTVYLSAITNQNADDKEMNTNLSSKGV